MFPARGIGALVVLVLAPVPTAVLAQDINFRVAEQPATAGIPEFARQAGIQIVSPAGIEGLKTRAVNGRYSIEVGLRKLLRGTRLFVRARVGNAISLAAQPATLATAKVERLKPQPRSPRPPVRAPMPQAEHEVAPDIIVTGTTSPERRLDAGLAITTVTLDQIHQIAPNNTADVLKLVPGIWAETTGGATGANVFVRGFPTTGDAPFLTVQLDGAPIYPPTELTFSENTTLFRIDDMITRVEILRGGTSPIFSNGQPGAIMNFIQRTGTPELHGGARLTTTDYGTRRLDAYVTGPFAPDTVFAIGGFYRAADGLRNTQFPADLGGQITANATHNFSIGFVTAYARYTRDRNAFYTGIPLLADSSGGFSALPGFDPLKGTLIGRDTEHLFFESGPNTVTPINLNEGRGLNLVFAGSTLQLDPSDRLRLTNRLNVTTGYADTVGLFTGPVPETLGQYIADTIMRANSDPRVLAAAGPATSGRAVVTSTGTLISPDRYVLTAGLWSVTELIHAVTDELRISRTLGRGQKLTGGLYYSHYHTYATDLLGNNLLLLAEPNARRVDLVLNNGVQATTNGFASATTSPIVDTSENTNIAVFTDDEWTVSPRTRVDAGVRFEHQRLSGRLREVQANVDFDGNPMTLFDNNGALLLPSSDLITSNANRLSLSIDVIHKPIADRLTLHARYNHGSNLPSFDKIRVGGPQRQSADIFEAGADVVAGPIRGSVNAFVNHFTGLQFTRLLEQPDGTVNNIVLQGGAHAVGMEVEANVAPAPHWMLELRGTYEDGRYHGFGANSGHQVVRQPRLQFSLSPTYSARIGTATIKLQTTYDYVGKRYSDVENLQPLPTYSTVDASIHAELSDGLYADLIAQNLANTFALTEGNTRILGAVISSGPIIARPLFGRNVSLSVGYRF